MVEDSAAENSQVGGRPCTNAGLWVAACAGLALVTTFIASPGVLVQRPPSVEPGWILTAALGILSLAVTFRASRRHSTLWPRRLGFALATVAGLAALLNPVANYYANFGDFPWVLAPIVAFIIIGSWLGRQQWVAAVLLLLMGIGSAGALVPASSPPLPITLRSGGLGVTLAPLARYQNVARCSFTLQGSAGVRLEDVYDIDQVRLVGSGHWGLLPVVHDGLHRYPPEFWPQAARGQQQLATYMHPPLWWRSFDLTLEVPRWPAQPAASVSFRAPASGRPWNREPVTVRGRGITVTAMMYYPSRRGSESGPDITIDYNSYRFNSGFLAMRSDTGIRVSDQNGHVLRIQSTGRWLSGAEAKIYLTLEPLDTSVRRVVIDAFTREQVERSTMRFRFGGLRNPRWFQPGRQWDTKWYVTE